MNFVHSAAVHNGLKIADTDGSFVQYVADNVNHNFITINGKNTFHGMGMVTTITLSIPRSSAVSCGKVTNEDIITIR